MGIIAYKFFLILYGTGIRMASLWNVKARKWLEGRKQKIEVLDRSRSTRTFWIHCASLGEFEQCRPLLEQLKAGDEKPQIVLTFFSPSGYEACKNYAGADHIFYLPMDSKANAREFIDTINPAAVLWVKYEYWFYYLQELQSRKIPVLLISGIFRKNQPFFKWYGGIWKKMLGCFTHFFVQNEASKQLLNSIGFTNNVTLSGDTRFDRVLEIAASSFDFPFVKTFCQDKKLLVAGSTWEDDEMILSAYADETHHREKIIIAPHELDNAHLNSLKKIFKNAVFYSEIEKGTITDKNLQACDVVILDTMGMLSRLYSYAYVSYIGGGFTNDGIHNILEAAVWGKPIIIGENYEKYFEAADLVDCLAAESIGDTNELRAVMDRLQNDKEAYAQSAGAAKSYVYENGGATRQIMEYLRTYH
jgi:3-deoxy-D-manno-octulosonic-acid transferase